jgi:hypothetical protein
MHRTNLLPRKSIPITVAAILSMAAGSVPVFASTDSDTENGPTGTNGANGTGGVNSMLQFVVTPGQPGTDGGFLEAEASGTTASDNFATDTGGNLGKSASGAAVEIPASDYAAIDAFAAANGLMADVPEPSSALVIAIAGIGALARRRRRF